MNKVAWPKYSLHTLMPGKKYEILGEPKEGKLIVTWSSPFSFVYKLGNLIVKKFDMKIKF